MLIHQEWVPGPLVLVLVARPCTNGQSGWEFLHGTYDPQKGETMEQVQWKFGSSAGSLLTLLQHWVFTAYSTYHADENTMNLADILNKFRDAMEALTRSLKVDPLTR